MQMGHSVLNAKMKFFSAQSGTSSASEFEQFAAEMWLQKVVRFNFPRHHMLRWS